MAKKKLTEQEKMDAWHNGTRRINVGLCSDQKLLEYFKICNESGYFLQSVKLRKEIHNRELYYKFNGDEDKINIIEMEMGKIPDSYYQNHTPEEITKDLITYLNAYVTHEGDSVYNCGLKVGKKGALIYYGFEADNPEIAINTDLKLIINQWTQETVRYTQDLEKALNMIQRDLFCD
jgi:hypothetical protein